MNNFTLRDSIILDSFADGVNFHRGVTNSTVENTFVRNTGDDGLSMFSEQYADVGNKFISNTVILPTLANNIAVYGGHNIEVSDNLLMDTIADGGGIHVSNRYNMVKGESGVKGRNLYKHYTQAMNNCRDSRKDQS